jgi:ketosteroid isomerase-like protein
MSTPEKAAQLASDWLEAWNAHDLDRILAHYSETVEFEFRLHKILAGVRSVTVCYESVNDLMAAEVMELDDAGAITRVLCHYAPR